MKTYELPLHSSGILCSADWQLVAYVSGQPIGPISRVQQYSAWIAWPLRMQPIGCPETSITNHHSMLRKIPEWEWSHLHHAGSRKSYKLTNYLQTRHLDLKGPKAPEKILRKLESLWKSSFLKFSCPLEWNLVHVSEKKYLHKNYEYMHIPHSSEINVPKRSIKICGAELSPHPRVVQYRSKAQLHKLHSTTSRSQEYAVV
jgi:hypothetical protein